MIAKLRRAKLAISPFSASARRSGKLPRKAATRYRTAPAAVGNSGNRDDGKTAPARGAQQVFDRQGQHDTLARDLRNAATSRNISLPGQKVAPQ